MCNDLTELVCGILRVELVRANVETVLEPMTAEEERVKNEIVQK